MEQMEGIRDQQENLAKLHFELGARQEVFTPLSEEALRASSENMELLMGRLETLSEAIGRLNPSAATPAEEEKEDLGVANQPLRSGTEAGTATAAPSR